MSEEYIKYIEGMIKEYKIFGDLHNPDYEDTDRIYRTLENILSEREQDKKRIKELEAKLEFKKWGDLDNIQFEEYIKQFIPIQKIKAKIEELDIAISECEYDDDDVEEYKNDVEKEKRKLLIRKSALEELLEDK